jgi:hypothetical protein
MNRRARRAHAAQMRRDRHNQFYRDYIRHLPQISMDAPLERGRVYHTVFMHSDDCGIYAKPNGTLADCSCNPAVTRHIEPVRA